MEEKQLIDISGSGGGGKGGGGGGRPAVEAPNTLRSSASVHIVEVISEGEIVGISGGAQGIYFNDTPLMASDGVTYNFNRAVWDYRTGLPSQPYMKGFSAAESVNTVNADVTVLSGPITRTVLATTDALKVTILLPNGLYVQDTSTGDMNGTEVVFTIETKITSSGTWGYATQYVINGKTTSPYERQYRVERPIGTFAGTWDVRVTRVTADDTTAAKRSSIKFENYTEIQEVKDATTEYDNTAVVGLVVDAQSVGNAIPVRSYLVKGLKVQVPSNYNPVTRVYTGTWNGTFQTAWTDNPAWVLYDLITNARYGLGEFIPASRVDKWSFYDASVYNDAGYICTAGGVYVSGGVSDGAGGFEPRYTFNAVIAARDDAYRIFQTVAGAMRGSLVDFNGLITLLQDRPASPVKLVTKANVIGGNFDYKSSGLFERHTAFNVTYNDRKDRHLQKVVTIDASTQSGAFGSALTAAQAKFGYNPIDIAAYGCVTESQALRHGRWSIDTELNQTEIVQFKMSLNGFDLMPGEIIKIYDEDYAATVGGGRIVSVTGTTVVLDRAVTLTTGSTIDVVLADGFTIETKSIVQTSGTVSTFTIASGFSQAVLANADYIVTTTVAARQFKILAIKQDAENAISVEAVFHDPNKYSRVETGVSVATPLFSNALTTTCTAPTNLTFKEIAVNADNTIKRSLLVSWMQPTTGIAAYYSFMFKANSGSWTTITNLKTAVYELVNIPAGVYEVKVYAHSAYGNQSPEVTGTYTILMNANGVSTFSAPTNLIETNGGATTFTGPDLNFKWTNPASNASVLTATLKDFEVKVIETVGLTTLRTFYLPAVAAGATQSCSYTYGMNNADSNNAPRRTLKIEVRARDANGNITAPIAVTFTNAVPATVSGLTASGGFNLVNLKWNTVVDNDLRGYLVWRDTTAGFTPGAGNLVADTVSNAFMSGGLTDASTYYYKVAAYDSFIPETDKAAGTGLNISTVSSATTLAPTNTNEYQLNGVTWTPNSPSTNSVAWTACTAVKTQGTSIGTSWSIAAGNAAWTSGILYIYYVEGATTLSTTTTLATAVAANKMIVATYRGGSNLEYGDGKAYIDGAYIMAGTIAAGNLVTGTAVITQGAQIANATIGDAHFTGLLTAAKIDARGLSIKDGAGNIILSAGNPLAASNITPDSGWLNSNLTSSITAAQNTANAAQASGQSLAPPIELWAGASPYVTTVSDGAEGNTVVRISTSTYINDGIFHPIDTNRKYKTRFWARAGAGTNGVLYHDLQQFTDAAGTTCATNGGRSPYFPSSATAHTGWVLYEHIWQTGDWQSGVKYVRPDWLGNYSGTTGYWEIQGYKFWDVTEVEAAVKTDLSNAPAGVLNSNVTATSIGAIKTDASNAPTSVLNSNITISSGTLNGIGTAGVVVDNSLVTASGIGAVKTDLTNAPANILNSNVLVGGANLMRNSGQWSATSTPWASNGSAITMDTTVPYGAYASMKFVGSGGGQNTYIARLKPSTVYTVSAMVKGSTTIGSSYDQTLHIQSWRDEDTGNVHQETAVASDTAVTTSWKRIYQTFTTPASATMTYCRMYFYPLGAGITLNVGYVQLEEGNVPTDWSQNADDLLAGINSAATTATWTGVGSKPANLAALTGSESINNGNISISSAGVLTGAGGGTVSLSGLGAGDMATINQITGANISTYIAGAAITDAYIGSLSASKINAGTMNASYISAGTITTDRLIANAASAYNYFITSIWNVPGTTVASLSTGVIDMASWISTTAYNVSGYIDVKAGCSGTQVDNFKVSIWIRWNNSGSGDPGTLMSTYHNMKGVALNSTNWYCQNLIPIAFRSSRPAGAQFLFYSIGVTFYNSVGASVSPATSYLTTNANFLLWENKV